MKKFLKTAILGAAFSTSISTGALAGDLWIVNRAGDGTNLTGSHTDNDITAASEKIIPGYKINIGNINNTNTGRDIIYSTSTDLANGSLIYFKLTNAKWEVCEDSSAGKIYLIGKDSDFGESGNKTGDAIIVGIMDACEDPNENIDPHYIKIILSTDFPAGKQVYFHQAATLPSVDDNDGAFDNDGDTTSTDNEDFIVAPTITGVEISQGAADGKITLEGVYAQHAGSSITGGKADAIDLVTFKRQFGWKLNDTNGENNSIIDVNPDDPTLARKVFVQNGNETPNIDESVVVDVEFVNDASNLDDKITLTQNDKLKITLEAEYPFTDYLLDLGNGKYALEYDLDKNGLTTEDKLFTIDSADPKKATIEIDADASKLGTDNIYLKVNKTAILNPQKITAHVQLYLPGQNNFTEDLFNGIVYDWSINGAQFKISYMFNSDSTFVRIVNESSLDGEITADVQDEAGNTITAVSLGTVPAKGALILRGSEIYNAAKNAGWTPSGPRFTVKLTVAAPEDQVSAVAVQKIPGGVDRVIPVLTPDTQEWKQ